MKVQTGQNSMLFNPKMFEFMYEIWEFKGTFSN